MELLCSVRSDQGLKSFGDSTLHSSLVTSQSCGDREGDGSIRWGRWISLSLAARCAGTAVDLLLEKRIDANGQDGSGWTPLYVAVLQRFDTVKPLMERHRHLNFKNFRRKNSVDGSFEEMVRGYRGSSTEGEDQ